MPAKDIYHDAVVDALTADGWTITDDPLSLKVGDRDLLIDLGAERPVIGAERGNEKIAVEVQSFVSPSAVADLQRALGQYTCTGLRWPTNSPIDRSILAVPIDVYNGILSEPLGTLVVTGINLRLLVFEPARREVLRWIS